MRRTAFLAISAVTLIAACEQPGMTFEEAREYCSEQAAAAAGPQGEASFAIGTGGPSASLSISIADSFIRGDDPQMVYDRCMAENAPVN